MPVTNLTSGCQRGPGPRVVESQRLAAEGEALVKLSFLDRDRTIAPRDTTAG